MPKLKMRRIWPQQEFQQKQTRWENKNKYVGIEKTGLNMAREHIQWKIKNTKLFNLIFNHQIVSKNDIFILIKEIIDFYKITKCLDWH